MERVSLFRQTVPLISFVRSNSNWECTTTRIDGSLKDKFWRKVFDAIQCCVLNRQRSNSQVEVNYNLFSYSWKIIERQKRIASGIVRTKVFSLLVLPYFPLSRTNLPSVRSSLEYVHPNRITRYVQSRRVLQQATDRQWKLPRPRTIPRKDRARFVHVLRVSN